LARRFPWPVTWIFQRSSPAVDAAPADFPPTASPAHIDFRRTTNIGFFTRFLAEPPASPINHAGILHAAHAWSPPTQPPDALVPSALRYAAITEPPPVWPRWAPSINPECRRLRTGLSSTLSRRPDRLERGEWVIGLVGARRRDRPRYWDFPASGSHHPHVPPALQFQVRRYLLRPGCPCSCSWGRYSFHDTHDYTRPSAQNTSTTAPPVPRCATNTPRRTTASRSGRTAGSVYLTIDELGRPPAGAARRRVAVRAAARSTAYLGPYRPQRPSHAREGNAPANAFNGASPLVLESPPHRASPAPDPGASATRVRLVSFHPPCSTPTDRDQSWSLITRTAHSTENVCFL